ncbi:MAG: Flp pilus assembly complex ATPase component TadA, partial [Firmicutes bacterium]|nr:Flp pilus assembly complex ATPase component TadA [Bacillota bacterium]
SLRMRPDRIIVGEVRGAEVVDMLAAMSTGHDGSLSTGHSNSCRGMILRLESLFLSASGFPIESIRGQIAEGIDILVHLARSRDGRRRVMEISQIGGISGGEIEIEPLFRLSGGELKRTDAALRRTEKLELYGSGRADGDD